MKVFQYDAPLITGINKVVDIFWLSILWSVCCIPVVTAGAATTALYYTAVKSLRKNRDYVTKSFFHALKTNFLPAAGLEAVFLLGMFLLYCGFLMAASLEDEAFRFFVTCIYLFFAFIVLGTGCYAFPVLSRCRMKIPQLLRFSVGLLIKHFPYTLALTAIVLVCGAAVWMVPLLVFCLPAVGSMAYSFFMEKILLRYTPREEAAGTWYGEA